MPCERGERYSRVGQGPEAIMSGAKEAQVLQRRPGKRHREDIVVCERDLGPRVLDAYDTQVLQREEGLQDFNECLHFRRFDLLPFLERGRYVVKELVVKHLVMNTEATRFCVE